MQNSQNNNSGDDSSAVILSVDKESELGKKLFKQVSDIKVNDSCGDEIHPLYEGQYTIGPEKISRDYKFELIASRVPEIAKLKEDDGEVTVSAEKMEEVFDSIFGDYSDIDYGVFDFDSSDSDNEQSVRMSGYTITKTKDGKYIISYERENGPQIACEQKRYNHSFEYVGLSNTIDEKIAGIENDNIQLAMIVIEKKINDNADRDSGTKSDGYYGVLFAHGQDSEKYIWLGTQYIGNVIEK